MSNHVGTVANIDVHTFAAGSGRMVQVNFMRDYAQLTPGQVDSLRELLAMAARECRKANRRRRPGFVDRRALFLLAAFLLGMLVGCAPSHLRPIQCPESPRTHCPAQHPVDSSRGRGK